MNTLPATSAQLLQTAERLFAQLGIDAVSTRRIAQEAKQRNVSALQYHFGSKDNLIDALLAMRLESINAHRQQMLNELPQPLAQTDLHDLVRALVLPLAEQLDMPGNHFVGCLYQLYLHARGERVYSNMQPELTAALQTVTHAIAQRLDLPPTVLLGRLRLMGSQVIHSVGDWYYQRERGESLPPTAELAATLIDFIVGGLLAPVSTPGASAKSSTTSTRRQRTTKNTRKDIRDE